MGVWDTIRSLITKVKRKGFWLYTALIVTTFAYAWYSIDHLPPPPKTPPRSPRMNRIDRRRRSSVEVTLKQHPDDQLSQLHKVQSAEEPSIVDTWDRHQLARYLHDERVFPPAEVDLDELRRLVKQRYNADMQHMS